MLKTSDNVEYRKKAHRKPSLPVLANQVRSIIILMHELFEQLKQRILSLDGVQQTSDAEDYIAYRHPQMSRQFVSIKYRNRFILVRLALSFSQITDPLEMCTRGTPSGRYPTFVHLTSPNDFGYIMLLVGQAYNHNLIKEK